MAKGRAAEGSTSPSISGHHALVAAEDWQHRYEDSVAREDARMASNLDELG